MEQFKPQLRLRSTESTQTLLSGGAPGAAEFIRLGNLLAEKCALEEARQTYRQAFNLARSQGDVRTTAEALGRLMRMASEARDTAEISQWERELKALMVSFPTQIPSTVWYCHAVLAGQREQWKEAQAHLRQFLRAMAHEEADPEFAERPEIQQSLQESRARAWVMLANTFTQRGHWLRAEFLLNWALRDLEARDIPGINGLIYLQLGWLRLRRRDAEGAQPWIEKAHASFLAHHNWYSHLYVLYAYACMARVRNDFIRANWYLDLLDNSAQGPSFAFFREQLAVERRRLQQESVDLQIDGRKLQVKTREKSGISLGKQYVLLHILEALCEAHHQQGGDSDRALSKADLIERVWGEKYRPHAHDNKLYYNINRLRKLIEPDMKEPQYLLNWKEGYRLAPGLKVQLQGANNPLKRRAESREIKGLKRGEK